MFNLMFKLIRNVDLIRIKINKDKFLKEKKGSCIVSIHPCLYVDLSQEEKNKINKNLEEITDILRNNIKNVEHL